MKPLLLNAAQQGDVTKDLLMPLREHGVTVEQWDKMREHPALKAAKTVWGDAIRTALAELDSPQSTMPRISSTNPYSSEWVTPDSGWNYTIHGLVPAIQIALVAVHRKLGLADCFTAKAVEYADDGRADGIIVFPFLRDLGTAYDIPEPTGNGYGRLGEKVWEKVSADRKGNVYNYRKGELGSNYVRLNAQVRSRLEALEAFVPAEEGVVHYHAIPTNTGSLFAGYGPRNARVTALEQGILPLGFVQVLCIMLAWLERLNRYSVRWIDCPADEYDWDAGGAWARCPCVGFDGGMLGLDARGAGNAHGLFGSAVAFPGVPGNS